MRHIIVGSNAEVVASFSRTDPHSAAGMLLAGGAAWYAGDLRNAERAMRAALGAASREEHACVRDALASVLVACGRYARAAAVLTAPGTGSAAEARLAALRSLVHAATGAAAGSVREASAARRAANAHANDDALQACVAGRLAEAAYFRGDASAALAEIERGLRAARTMSMPRARASLHAVACAVCRRLRGDADAVWRHALSLRESARAAGDVLLQARANEIICEAAGERGDEPQANAACGAAPARPSRAAAPFGCAVTDALRFAWRAELRSAFAILRTLESAPARFASERVLCRALLALVALACDDAPGARRSARRAVSTSGLPGARAAADELRRVCIARALAAVACELAGDVARGRRAAAARVLRADATAAALWDRRDAATVDAMPASVRGYARLAFAARDRVRSRGAPSPLTPAEAEIVRSIADGHTVARIAADTGRSPHTVRTHLRNASAKLGAHGRAQLVERAREAGAV